MKNNAKLKSIEDAIIAKFPDVVISEVRTNKYGTRVLGVVPAKGDNDDGHIVEWTADGKATECRVGERNFMEVAWDEEEERPVYVKTKILLHNEAFNVIVDATT